MKVLDLEFQKVGITIENLTNSYGNEKFVGVISNPRIKNENGKCIGNIILLLNPKKKYLLLNQIVEFYENNIKYSHNYIANDQFFLISDHWVKPYIQDPIIKVPIKVLDSKTGNEITEMIEYTYNQFQENRLLEFYGKYNHRLVAAYKNFTNLFKNNQYWYSINSTSKHYRVPSDWLIKFISKIDNEKKRIKSEWIRYLNYSIQEDQRQLKIKNLIDRYENQSRNSKVINIKN